MNADLIGVHLRKSAARLCVKLLSTDHSERRR